MESLELYKILKNNRDKLPEYLKSNCSYDHLKTQLLNTEKYYETKNKDCKAIIKNLFLGNIGQESNKQKAIYELPTNELLTILKYIIQFVQINEIEEVCAGLGLLSHMLKYTLGDNYTITASDGNRWIETSSEHKYYNVPNKLLLNYCRSVYSLENKFLIVSWPPIHEINDFLELVETKKPKYFIVIDNKNNYKLCNVLYSRLEMIDYKMISIQVKQLCYKDYFHYNELATNISNSNVFFCTRDTDLNINNMLLNIKFKYNDCLVQEKIQMSDKIIIQTLINNYVGKKYLLHQMAIDNNSIKEITESMLYITNKKIQVPDYIQTYPEYVFWYNKLKHNKYPLNLNNRKKFKEYKKLSEQMSNINDFITLKEKGILPSWVSSNLIAQQVLWLEYSTPNKIWKTSYEKFCGEFNNIRRQR